MDRATLTHPNPIVGCVIVANGDIVGEVITIAPESRMPSVHALRMAAQCQRRNRLCHAWNPVAIMGERRHVVMR
ncbi:hypothetical protein KCP76_15850 [Salmonella enterica subsp. enterica serovar Weltevreden]|nr:hypothetical protein KCP76_15850 [Salmonella enterica subsp. enterica serovar Weltevreden]